MFGHTQTFFARIWVHKVVYLVLLLAWLAMNRNAFSCPCCSSSFGMPYWRLFWPPALMLLALLVYETHFCWQVFLVWALWFAHLLVVDQLNWFTTYQSKREMSDIDVAMGQFQSLTMTMVILLPFFALLWLIRPGIRPKLVDDASAAQA